MKKPAKSIPNTQKTARLVRDAIEQGGERLWRLEDFEGQPFTAVAQALSRLAKEGVIERLSKGTYYRPKQTTFGQSRPNPTEIQKLAGRKHVFFPSGVSAANLLGLSTQMPKRGELATNANSLPRKLLGRNALVHTRRPAAWSNLNAMDAAILDLLRNGGRKSELSPEETIQKLLKLLKEGNRFQELAGIAMTEPPRVRAILGALGQQLKVRPQILKGFRQSLNPLSRFDFGVFSKLQYAKEWQAKRK